MGAVYDLATREQRPDTDDHADNSSSRETAGMAEEELNAFWRGVAWATREFHSPTPVDMDLAAKGERLFNERRAARRSRLEVV